MYGALVHESKLRESNMFHTTEINAVCKRLQVSLETSAVVEIMRNECFLLLKGPHNYQLNIV